MTARRSKFFTTSGAGEPGSRGESRDMELVILDTDTCIYWLKGDHRIEKRIIDRGLRHCAITVITECELYYGAMKSQKAEKNITAIEELRRKVRTLHTGDGVSGHFGRIKSDLEKKGLSVDDADLLIASIALMHDALLVSNNTEHFKRIKGLKLENWAL